MRKLYGIFLLIALITMVTSCYSQDINKNYLLKSPLSYSSHHPLPKFQS